MRFAGMNRLIGSVAVLVLIGLVNHAHAQFGVGTTWVRTDAQGKGIVLTVAACCNGGLRLTYQVPAAGGQPAMTLTVDSPMDGKEAPALLAGKPSGETMAVTRLDDHHYSAVVKVNGQLLTTSTGTVAPDGKTMTVESVSQGNKVVETWVRK